MAALAKSLFGETDSVASAEFLEALLADYPNRDFQVRLWNGTIWGAVSQPHFTLVLKHPGALRAMFSRPSELTLGEAYIYDDFDIEGDIEAAFELADYLLAQERSLGKSFDLARRLQKLPVNSGAHRNRRPANFSGSVHSRDRDRQAISYHYDLPAAFYSLWLDPRMVYSCAYFATPEEDLDAAQERKLDYICRKLRLRPGERLLDIGCGWGGLIIYAAAHYGVEAVGITLSVPQAELARQRLHQAGLNDRCRVEVADYRDIEHGQPYDKIVSVGMFEHVGEAFLSEYFQRAYELLRRGGVFLNHGIACSATHHPQGQSFSDRYAFPDSEMVAINTTLREAEQSGFEVRDVESLREHYALTLHNWVQRMEAHAQEVRRVTDDTTYRIWRLCMAGSAHRFHSGRLTVYQTLLAKPLHADSGLPLTRDDWYRA